MVDPHTFERLIRLNIIPDREERVAEIMADPAAAGYFTGINLLIGEGNDQYVDDAFTSHDGRFLYVSRPSFKDVVAFDLATREIVWRFQVDGYRSDHMAISPDGRDGAGLGLDRQRRPRDRHGHRHGGLALRVRRLPAREQLLGRRQADLPRQHRARVHAGRRARARRQQGRPLLPGRRRRDAPDPQAGRHGPEARGGRLPGHELGGAPDGAHARREARLPAGLVLPRLRRVRPASRTGCCASSTCRSARRRRRSGARSTCSTPPTTGSR